MDAALRAGLPQPRRSLPEGLKGSMKAPTGKSEGY